MAVIIWIVIITYIVLRCVSVSKKNAKQARPNVPRSSAQMQRHTQTQLNRRNTVPTAGTWTNPAMQAQQQKRTSQQGRTVQQKQENSILQKAKANAQKQFDDDVLEKRAKTDLNRVPLADEIMKDQAKANHIHSEHEAGHANELRNQHGVDDFDTYHLIDEVNDLIVKGYSGNLEFERDFLAEATDMLNRMYG